MRHRSICPISLWLAPPQWDWRCPHHKHSKISSQASLAQKKCLFLQEKKEGSAHRLRCTRQIVWQQLCSSQKRSRAKHNPRNSSVWTNSAGAFWHGWCQTILWNVAAIYSPDVPGKTVATYVASLSTAHHPMHQVSLGTTHESVLCGKIFVVPCNNSKACPNCFCNFSNDGWSESCIRQATPDIKRMVQRSFPDTARMSHSMSAEAAASAKTSLLLLGILRNLRWQTTWMQPAFQIVGQLVQVIRKCRSAVALLAGSELSNPNRTRFTLRCNSSLSFSLILTKSCFAVATAMSAASDALPLRSRHKKYKWCKAEGRMQYIQDRIIDYQPSMFSNDLQQYAHVWFLLAISPFGLFRSKWYLMIFSIFAFLVFEMTSSSNDHTGMYKRPR